MRDDDSDFLREVEAGDAAFLVTAPRKELPPWRPTKVTVTSIALPPRPAFSRFRFWLKCRLMEILP